TISWEMRTTALRISSEVMIRRPFTRSLPASRGPHSRLAGRGSKVGAECSVGPAESVAAGRHPGLAEDQDVRGGLRLDLAERIATPAEHLERALVAVLARRAHPGEAVLADREAPE